MGFNIKKTLASFAAVSALFVFGGNINQAKATSTQSLARMTYTNKDVVMVDHNKPRFKKSDLKKRAWQKYSNLDGLNRAGAANAMLNQSLMPTTEREPLIWNPTGWHNKRIAGGWLYNRCHLIGYQLTGQNNNPKNLITGTRQLNDPDMLKYENKVADYLKDSSSNYIRYRVTPAFRGNELLARGVRMEGQSVGSNAVKFDVYIFNAQPGVKINYKTGNSTVSKAARSTKATAKRTVRRVSRSRVRKTTRKSAKKVKTSNQGLIIGNKRSKIYHVPGQAGHRMSSSNAVYFHSEAAARAAGYRKSLR